MMVARAAVYRDLGKYHGQNRVSYRGGCVGHESAFIIGLCTSGEWPNRRRCGGWTDWWGVARWRAGVTARSAAAGLLRAGAGLCRGACLPSGARALLGWLWLASSPRPGLRLIAELFCSSRFEQNQMRPPMGGLFVWPQIVAPVSYSSPSRLRSRSLARSASAGLGNAVNGSGRVTS